MLRFESKIKADPKLFARFGTDSEKVLFFDIETTGFSPQSAYIYLIGCAFYSEGQVTLRQWMLEDINLEKEMLMEFEHFLKNFEVLVHFNGTTFDVPFLSGRCKRYRTKDFHSALRSEDIYRSLLPFKKLFHLTNMKQKSLEEFLGIHREDRFSGGDLIPVFTEFLGRYRYEQLTSSSSSNECAVAVFDTAQTDFSDCGLKNMPETPAKALLSVLLMHNYEDVIGLLEISALTELLDLNAPATEFHINTATTSESDVEFIISSNLSDSVLQAVFHNEILLDIAGLPASLSYTDKQLFLRLPIYFGTLKYFFANPSEYYFLPEEDCAIHKSVASFVDKDHRVRATKDNCYQKKSGRFLYQASPIFEPVFKTEAKSADLFFEIPKEDEMNWLNIQKEKTEEWLKNTILCFLTK